VTGGHGEPVEVQVTGSKQEQVRKGGDHFDNYANSKKRLRGGKGRRPRTRRSRGCQGERRKAHRDGGLE